MKKLVTDMCNLELLEKRREQIIDIIRLRKEENMSVEKIARIYEVSAGCINRILWANNLK